MKRPTSVFGVMRLVWMEKFRRQPFATVAGTLIGVAAIVGFLFISVFLSVALITIGAVALLYQKLLPGKSPQGRYRHAGEGAGKSSTYRQRDVIEGDFKEVSDDALESGSVTGEEIQGQEHDKN